jgi:hypothetical protein
VNGGREQVASTRAGLAPGTLYIFRCKARNSAGEVKGELQSLTTLT